MFKADKLLRSAYWIWPEPDSALRNVYADFRHDFSLSGCPARTPFFITADQCYMLYVNGHYIGRGPARGFQVSWPYDEFDLSAVLRRGHNWISVRVYNAGGGTFQYIHQGAYGMLCAGRIGRLEIASGEEWIARLSPAYRRDTAKLSLQLNYQEWVDARLDDQSWIRSRWHPSGWGAPRVRQPFGHMPWHALEPRGIPNLGNEVLEYRRVVARAAGRRDKFYKEDSNLTRPWFRELKHISWKNTEEDISQRRHRQNVIPDLSRVARDEIGNPDSKNDHWIPACAGLTECSLDWLTIPAAGKGGLRAAVLDLERPSVGALMVEAVNTVEGETVDFFFCEVVSAEGRPLLSDPTVGCAIAMSARLIMRPGRTRFNFFQMMGHRYLTVIARDTRRPLKMRLGLLETIYPMEIRGDFKCGDETLNRIYKICARTQQVCSLDGYVDTPWREQGQWWGDARVQAQNTFHLSADVRLLARGIRSIARQEVPNGLTYGHAPTISHHCILPDFSIIWALTIWDYYYQTGDIRLFLEQWQRIERLQEYFCGEGRSKNGLLKYDRRYWLFLDWCDIHRSGNPALFNLWYLLMLEKLAEMARIAGMKDQYLLLTAQYRRHRCLVLDYLWDKRAALFHDGLRPDGRPVKTHSIHTQTLALLCGLRPAGADSLIAGRLLPYLRGEKIPGAQPSSYWVSYVYEFMKRAGYGLEVVKHIRKKWAPMIPYGGTWETFVKPDGIYSASHAWAAHPIYHLTGILGGVLQNDVAWKKIIFRPVIHPEYQFAGTIVPTPQGAIKSGWAMKQKTAEVTLALPPGVQADVYLPGFCEQVTGKKKWLVDLEN